MPTIAIVGAGPQFGLSVAQAFGSRGYRVGLIARNEVKLAAMTDRLAEAGIDAASYPADVRDSQSLISAIGAVVQRFGDIDVLSFSPLPAAAYLKPVLETTPDDALDAFQFSVLGTMRAVEAVLPGMRERRTGSLLFTSGGSSLTPNENVAGTSIAMAGEAAYLTMLHKVLAPENIHVAHLVVRVGIAAGSELGAPDQLAEQLWHLHEDREFRSVIG